MRVKKPEVKPEEPRYIIISGESLESIQTTVNYYITKGYNPVGGVAVNNGFYQAMMRAQSYTF